MSEVSTSRRDVMRALAIVPAAIATPTVAAAAFTRGPTKPSLAITEAIAAYHKAATYENEWCDRHYTPAWKACKAAIERIPHLTTETRHEVGGRIVRWSTDNPTNQAEARYCRQVLNEGRRLAKTYKQLVEEFEEKVAWRAAEERRIQQRYGMDLLDAEQDRLTNASYDAMRAVEEFPAATIHDLIAKVEFAGETEGRSEPEELLADLRRIAGRAAA